MKLFTGLGPVWETDKLHWTKITGPELNTALDCRFAAAFKVFTQEQNVKHAAQKYIRSDGE